MEKYIILIHFRALNSMPQNCNVQPGTYVACWTRLSALHSVSGLKLHYQKCHKNRMFYFHCKLKIIKAHFNLFSQISDLILALVIIQYLILKKGQGQVQCRIWSYPLMCVCVYQCVYPVCTNNFPSFDQKWEQGRGRQEWDKHVILCYTACTAGLTASSSVWVISF